MHSPEYTTNVEIDKKRTIMMTTTQHWFRQQTRTTSVCNGKRFNFDDAHGRTEKRRHGFSTRIKPPNTCFSSLIILIALGFGGSGGLTGRSEAGEDLVDEFAARFIRGRDVHFGFAFGSISVDARAQFRRFDILIVTIVDIICFQAAVAFTVDQRLGGERELDSIDGVEDSWVGDGTAVHVREHTKVD
jgi:hypothetical protein